MAGVYGVALEDLGGVDRPEGDGAIGMAEGDAIAAYPREGGGFDVVVVGETEGGDGGFDPFCE